MFNDFAKIGIGLTGFGILFTFLGILLFFDKALLAMGNILFLSGVVLIIGVQRTSKFFFQKSKLRGSALFFSGMGLVLLGWPIIGVFVEAFGFVNLFGNFFPVAISFAQQFPVIGPAITKLLEIPIVKTYVDKIITSNKPSPV